MDAPRSSTTEGGRSVADQAHAGGGPFSVFDDPGGEDFTVGIEEEFLLVDQATRAPRPDADQVLAGVDVPDGTTIGLELKRSQLETGSAVCRDLAELRSSVAELRRRLAEAAGRAEARIVAIGTHPLAGWGADGGLTPEDEYLALGSRYEMLASEQTVCGCHVHVGVRDPELAIQVMDRVRVHIPLLVALAANSPFWMGHDTRYASYRTQVFHRWPTSGIPEHLGDRAAYDQVVADLRSIEAIDEPARLYWDVRPSARYPTLEFRACDVATTVDEAVVVAALIRALVETAHRAAVREEPSEAWRPELLRSALWRASRYGMAGRLVDLRSMRLVPAPELLGQLLDTVRPVLEERGELEAVIATLGFVLREGTGAERQRAAGKEGPEPDPLLAVVDRAATATTAAMG